MELVELKVIQEDTNSKFSYKRTTTTMNTKMMPCGCIMEWDEGVFKLSLCRMHGLQFEQKEVIDYSGNAESRGKRNQAGPYG